MPTITYTAGLVTWSRRSIATTKATPAAPTDGVHYADELSNAA